MSTASPALTSLSFEDALTELETIVEKLERGTLSLDESIALYERGEVLRLHGESLLTLAGARIETITQAANGQAAGTAPLDPAG